MAEKSVELDSIELAAAIFGNCDQNVKLLENEFHVTAVCRGSLLKFTGEPKDVEAAVHAVDGMVTLMQNHTPLEEQTVRYCISLARGGEEKRLRELNDDFVAVTAKGRPIHPKTLGQKEYLSAIRANSITFGVGPAGTGKTYLAVAMAVKAFKSKDVSRIILTRPAVEAGEKENGTTRSSPNCSSILEKSMLRLSIRAGVPVLTRTISTPFAFSESVRCVAACRPFGPVYVLTSP